MNPVTLRVVFRGVERDVVVLDDTGGPAPTRRIRWQFAELEDPPIQGHEILAMHRQLASKLRAQADADAFLDALDALDEHDFEALARAMTACGCTLLCYWTDERIAHIRAHLDEVRKAPR